MLDILQVTNNPKDTATSAICMYLIDEDLDQWSSSEIQENCSETI